MRARHHTEIPHMVERDVRIAVPAWAERSAQFKVLISPPDSIGVVAAPPAFYFVAKRVLDVLLSTIALALISPLLLLVALLIRLTSPGPIIYRQHRVGKSGRIFTMYKFRSMRQGADRELASLRSLNEADGPLFKMRADPRVTRIGRLLRRTSIDELPQLLNVIHGEMSLVGPRPPLAHEVMQYAQWQVRRLSVTPGLTGLWQVSGRSNLGFDDGVRLDLRYIDECSLLLDLSILARTIPAVLLSRGAY